MAPDDVHVLHDTHALIQPGSGEGAAGLPPLALLLSSLLPTAPFVLLNVSLGDQARVIQRRCGCPLEAHGWTTHLETVRSFEKLTAGGIAFLDADLVRVLEEVLPARFGGGPTDYQLVEEEAESGRPCLRLLIHPAVGPLDLDEVADAFLQAAGSGSGIERLAGLLWQAGHFFQSSADRPWPWRRARFSTFTCPRAHGDRLRADQQFDLRATEARNTKDDWEDRAVALKAIGDLGTPQSRAYLEKERARLEKLTDSESVRTKALISMAYPCAGRHSAPEEKIVDEGRLPAFEVAHRNGLVP